MLKTRLLTASALVTAAVLAAPSVAFAQDTAAPESAQPIPEESADGTTPDSGEVVVTGSRIRRANDDSAVPITTVTPAQIFDSGRISVGDVLNDLPQLRSSLGSQNSTSGLGVRGLNFLDLRGLGRARTLALINGRRQVSADIINNGNAIDINTLPTDLIERVDIVTGGNSSIYGSDAIAGVVNFILKDDFEGVQIRGRSGVSSYGDAANQYASIVAGTNFADGRGNIAINAEYAHQEDYYASGRPYLRHSDNFVVVDTDTTSSFDDVPDRVFYRDLRSSTISLGGQLGIRYANNASAPCGLDSAGSSFTCGYLFQPNGSLVNQTGLRVGLGPNGNYIGGNGTTSREGRLVVLSPNLTRYVFNALGHFELSREFVPFFEAKYVRTEAFGTQSGPFFSQGQTLADGVRGIAGFAGTYDRSFANGTFLNAAGQSVTTGGTLQATTVNREAFRVDNPYLSPAARAAIVAQLTAAINSGVNPNTGTAYGNTPNGIINRDAALAQVAAGTFRVGLRRNYLDLGTRDEDIKRDTYRAVVGVRGDVGDNFNYEIAANYSEHHEKNVISGNINRQRFLLAMDTTRNAAGQIVCRSQVDSRYAGNDRGGNPTQLAADIAACVPLNPFGEGNISDAAKAYLLMPTIATGKAKQFVATAFMSGNTGSFFNLPGGPIGFSLGSEYRREKMTYDLDDLTQAGYAFYNAIPSFTPPAFEVKEAFAEISLPIVKDVFLLKELSLSGSGRVAQYKGNVGTVYAFSGGATYRPVRDIMFRGSYSRSVRAPYLGDVYSLPGQNFTPAPADPCSARNINTGSATRAANCAAAGRPGGSSAAAGTYDFVYTSSLEIVSGGNLDLKAEKSTSWTAGFSFQPTFIPGLSISSDYYDIKVDDVITSPSVQQALNACYDAPDLNNQFCALFQRAGANGGPRGEAPFRILEGSYQDAPRNYAKLKARGVDTNVSYVRRFDWGTVNLEGIWTHVFQRSNYTDPARPNYENVLLGELGDPSDAFNINADVRIGKFRLGYSMRWLDGMYLNTFEDYNGVNDEPPQNPDYADVKKYPSVAYHDFRIGFDVNDKFDIDFGVNNVFNKKPPFGVTGVASGSGIYDNRGRFFYAGATAKF